MAMILPHDNTTHHLGAPCIILIKPSLNLCVFSVTIFGSNLLTSSFRSEVRGMLAVLAEKSFAGWVAQIY
jgi:hypothetical protein